MHQIVQAAYVERSGLAADAPLPGAASVTGDFGRADIRLQVDEAGELYILSKSDGMIRAITGPEPLLGDYNYDGAVDAADYEVWRTAFGTTVPRVGLWADGNRDGLVDAADFNVWRDHFVASIGVAVPEPSATVLACLAALWFSIARRR
jgi:hypothetical protein